MPLAPVICPELEISHLCGLVSFFFWVFVVRLVARKSKRSVEDVSERCRCRSRAQSLRRRCGGGWRKEGRDGGRERGNGRWDDVIGGQDSQRKTHPGFISHQRVYFRAMQPTCSAEDASAVSDRGNCLVWLALMLMLTLTLTADKQLRSKVE